MRFKCKAKCWKTKMGKWASRFCFKLIYKVWKSHIEANYFNKFPQYIIRHTQGTWQEAIYKLLNTVTGIHIAGLQNAYKDTGIEKELLNKQTVLRV